MSGNTQCYGSRCEKKSRLGTDRSNSTSVVGITDVPENVLARILSLLPLKDAVRTSVLSKWWEYKWTLVYDIQIDDHHDQLLELAQSVNLSSIINAVDRIILHSLNFTNFVDRILAHSLDIQSFYLKCGHMRNARHFKIWISSLSRRNIRSIKIISDKCEGFTLPSCLLDNTSLRTLHLCLPCTMKVPHKYYLCNLKSLVLHSVHIQNECVSDTGLLQLTLPVLKVLYLGSCMWGDVKLLEINSPALTIFAFVSLPVAVAEPNDFLIKVCGAMLEQIHVIGLLLDNLDLSASSVVNATIFNGSENNHPFIGASGSRSQVSMTKFSGLRYMSLGGQIGMAYAQLMPGVPLPRFNRLQKLELNLIMSINKAFLELLHMAPNLEQLIIHEASSLRHESEELTFNEVESIPSCMSSHLAEIKLSKFVGTTYELDLVKFFLKNSLKLQKFVVSVDDKPQIPKAEIREILSTYAKGSPCISVVFT